jgi:hypothetical protein
LGQEQTFTQEEAAQTAGERQYSSLPSFRDFLDLPEDTDRGERLMEWFAGVPGYITALVTAFVREQDFTDFLATLDARVCALLSQAEITLDDIRNELEEGKWTSLHRTGLCGPRGPNNQMFASILRQFASVHTADAFLAALTGFKRRYGADPTFTGGLLTAKTILALQCATPLHIGLLSLIDGQWVLGEDTRSVPDCRPEALMQWTYQPPELIPFGSASLDHAKGPRLRPLASASLDHAEWHLVRLPPGFPVIDVLLAHRTSAGIEVFLIHIASSLDPFATHLTDETCSAHSRARVEALLSLVRSVIGGNSKIELIVRYLLHAPNCEPPNHVAFDQTKAYYFSPMDPGRAFAPAKLRYRQQTNQTEQSQVPGEREI